MDMWYNLQSYPQGYPQVINISILAYTNIALLPQGYPQGYPQVTGSYPQVGHSYPQSYPH